MTSPHRDKVTVAPDVLLTIARLSALSVPGVARMSAVPGGVDRFFRPGANDGIRLEVHEQTVAIDLYLVVRPTPSVRDISRAVQAEVARAFRDSVGMNVAHVNVHIEDIVFADPEPTP